MAAAHDKETGLLRDALEASEARLDRIPRKAAGSTLRQMPDHAVRHDLPFGAAPVLDPGRSRADA